MYMHTFIASMLMAAICLLSWTPPSLATILPQHPLKNNFASLHGPHITSNFPDPCIVFHVESNTTYAFATTNIKTHDPSHGRPHVNVQVASSSDNSTWKMNPHVDALPRTHLAPWQTGNGVWAPDVKQLPSGRWLLYYADSLAFAPASHCIGAATSDVITGPYTPLPDPLICPYGGAIDPAGFVDRSTGNRYIIYKVDSNSLGHGGSCNNDVSPIQPTPIMLQEVDPNDGVTLIGKPTKLLDRDALDGPLIEAPAMYRSNEGIYFLFFSSNCFSTAMYDVSYATAADIRGPYVKASRPLLITGDGPDLVGPGGMDILHHGYGLNRETSAASQGRMIVFHGHMTVAHKQEDQHRLLVRGMYTGTVYFKGRTVTLRHLP
ncbi:hypothetical protein H2198_000243 [Neophaeococcomyces mojaviensis]|uniref:Uncharacterized protein n=1 Tax=Neophaeococcomyces mojaviensis TaxID=3383035 RepID=A0ACC3AK65_9EURO|nr:hypothetical protein H2198_000243 [Knufia sp. JES_112]